MQNDSRKIGYLGEDIKRKRNASIEDRGTVNL